MIIHAVFHWMGSDHSVLLGWWWCRCALDCRVAIQQYAMTCLWLGVHRFSKKAAYILFSYNTVFQLFCPWAGTHRSCCKARLFKFPNQSLRCAWCHLLKSSSHCFTTKSLGYSLGAELFDTCIRVNSTQVWQGHVQGVRALSSSWEWIFIVIGNISGHRVASILSICPRASITTPNLAMHMPPPRKALVALLANMGKGPGKRTNPFEKDENFMPTWWRLCRHQFQRIQTIASSSFRFSSSTALIHICSLSLSSISLFHSASFPTFLRLPRLDHDPLSTTHSLGV